MFKAYLTKLAVCNQSHLVAETCNLPSDNYLMIPFMLQYPSIHLCLSHLKGALLSLWLWQRPSSFIMDSIYWTSSPLCFMQIPTYLDCLNIGVFGLNCFKTEWWIDKSTFWFLRFRIFWVLRWQTSDFC